jgi:cell division protein FtsI (penicillin-binding protein 3)
MSRAPDSPSRGGLAPARGTQARRALLLGALLALAAVVTVRAFVITVQQGDAWLARADEQHAKRLELPAPRGTIYDRNGVPLAASRPMYRVAIAPREVTDRAAVVAHLQSVLGLGAADARRAVSTERRWVVLRGRFDEQARDRLDGLGGVYFERVLQRFYPHGRLATELVGIVNVEGDALGGLELEFDSVLSGRNGMATVRRDHRGRPLPGAMLKTLEPVPGRDLHLSIDVNLQEIADAALRQAVQDTRSAGGELILLNPRTGEILAAASRRGATTRNWRAVMEPYEPGSTIKPFLVATLLAERRATMRDSVYAEHGRYVSNGRTLTDVRGYGWLTLEEALRVSSNIALAKMATRLDRGTQYRYLRDFGFGSPTAVAYPSESGGVLRRPAAWSGYSQASLAIGYEIAVTPLQIALAYGALANDGVLMEPRLVREVRSRDGRVEHTFVPRAVRQVVSAAVAGEIRRALHAAVEDGTGRQAQLGPYALAGKTGTSRVAEGRGYREGAYLSTFAGFFPADDPQLVFLVKLDEPSGMYFGGQTAAPATRAAIEATLAAHSIPVDRRALATAAVAAAPPLPAAPAPAAGSATPATGPFALALSVARPPRAPAPLHASGDDAAAAPDVVGLALRDAVRRLHAAGFSVSIEGSGSVRAMIAPAEPANGVVHLVAGGSR